MLHSNNPAVKNTAIDGTRDDRSFDLRVKNGVDLAMTKGIEIGDWLKWNGLSDGVPHRREL